MLRLWGTTIARPTRDIDLLGRGEITRDELATVIADCIVLLDNLELDGATIARAVSATFARRGTPMPVAPPIGLTDDFASDADKQKQWSAFVRRLRLDGAPTLSDVVTRLERFATPVFADARGEEALRTRWLPGSGWRS